MEQNPIKQLQVLKLRLFELVLINLKKKVNMSSDTQCF